MIPTIGVDVLVSLSDRISAPLRQAEKTVAAAAERMNRRLRLSMKLAGSGAAAAGIAYGTQRMVSGFSDSIRAVERAKGELATLGVRDLDAVVARGYEMQTQLAGITADAFVRASYDIKSGISSLTDQGVADMTAAAMLVAKATKGQAEQMTSLFATSYGIFKDQYAAMSDADFGNMFGAALSASVQQFKTDGAAMQQAIETAGAGAVNLGMQMTEQLVLLGMMQQQMQAGEAGTALRAFATNAARAHEAFGKMAVTAERPVRVRILDENGQLRAMPEILADLKARYGETLDAFEAAEIKQAFGTDEAMKMINALYGQEAAVRANAEALGDAADQGAAFTAQMARAADSNWDGATVLLSQKMDVLRQKIGERILPVLERLLPVFDAFIARAFDWIDANPELVTGIGAAVAALGALAAIMAPVMIGAAALVSGWAMLSYGATRLGLAVFKMGKWVAGAGRWLLWLARLVLPLVGKAVMLIGRALIANPIGAIVMGIAAAAFLVYEYWEPISAFFQNLWAQVVDAFRGAVDWITSAVEGVTGFDWAGLFTLDGLRSAWSAVSGFLGRVLGTLWDALSPLAWAGLVNSEDLATAWAAVTGFVTGTASKLWEGIASIEWSNYIPDLSWEGVVSVFTWDTVLTALDWASWLLPVRWLEFIPGFEWSTVIEGVLDWATWLSPLAWGEWVSEKVRLIDWVEGFEWADIIPEWNLDWSSVSAAINEVVSVVQAGWEVLEGIFDNIVAAARAVGEKVGEAITVALDGARAALAALGGDRGVERIFAELDALAENGWSSDFVQGQALTEALEAEQISLEAYRQALAAVVEEGGRFAEVAQQMIDASAQLDTFSLPAPPAPPMPPMEDIDAVSARLSAIQATAADTLAAVQSAINQIVALIQGTDLSAEGERIAASIAAGIRARIDEVRAAAAAMSAAIRSALPTTARVNVALTGAPAPIQARASGGWYKPGWLLTGEQGPELRYETQGGYIAHNRALRSMLDMASRTSELVHGLGFEAQSTSPVPALASVAAAAGPVTQRGPITLAPQYNMPISLDGRMDMDELRAAVRQELMVAQERAQADLRRVMHD